MRTRALLRGPCKLPSIMFLLTFLPALMLPKTARAQGLEVGGARAHVTGDFGTDGFNAGAAWWFTKQVTIAADYDSSRDTSSVTNFAFTQVGSMGHLANAGQSRLSLVLGILYTIGSRER